MPTGVYLRTEAVLQALRNRRVPPRTALWNKRIGDAQRKGKNKICPCGKEFFVHLYRYNKAVHCSNKCFGKYHAFIGYNKGKKILKGSLAKLGSKNPMYGKERSEEHNRKSGDAIRAYYDKHGRVSKEHHRMVKRILEYKRKASIKGKFLPEEWLALQEKYNRTCPRCGKGEKDMKFNKLTVDHIIPLSKGGTNTIENIQPLCLTCNCEKNNKTTIRYEIFPRA